MAVIGAFFNHKTRWFDEYGAKTETTTQDSKTESDDKSRQLSAGDK